jgi:hypothetical protein
VSVIRDPKQDEAIKNGTCYLGGEKVYEEIYPDEFVENSAVHAKGPGHIYSEAGLREYKNSGACEYHFDQAFAEPEEGEMLPDLDDDGQLYGEHVSEFEDPMTASDESFVPPFEY